MDYLPIASETVTCKFSGATGSQECFSSQGHSCKGVASCVAKVSGYPGTKLTWKSTCGSSLPSTVIDGKSESILFTCGTTYVSEIVTCVFKGSSKVEECSSSLGPSCKGVGSCSVMVSGYSGTTVGWKSSCGNYQTTILDGKSESLTIACGTPVSESMTCVFLGMSTVQTCSSSKGSCTGLGSCTVTVYGLLYEEVTWKASCTPSIYIQTLDGMPEKNTFCTGGVSETVTCLFPGSTTPQSCSSSKGSCAGVTSCSVAVKGTTGELVDWKSTCGGYAMTILDGKSETISFQCATPPPPPPPVSEWVTCLFKGSTTYQECYSPKGSCKGLLGCTVQVTGTIGEKVEWKSTCGGYATTVIDGMPEPANFVCGPQPGDGWGWPDAGPVPPDAGVPWPG
jgi:hypothetical protein